MQLFLNIAYNIFCVRMHRPKINTQNDREINFLVFIQVTALHLLNE